MKISKEERRKIINTALASLYHGRVDLREKIDEIKKDFDGSQKHAMSLGEQVACIKNQIETSYFVEAYGALDDLVEEFGN